MEEEKLFGGLFAVTAFFEKEVSRKAGHCEEGPLQIGSLGMSIICDGQRCLLCVGAALSIELKQSGGE